MSRPRGTGPERIEVPATLVWIDGDEAILVRWEGAARIERIGSEVAGLGFVEAVADRVPVGDDVRIVGPGDVRLRLGRRIREQDRRIVRQRARDRDAGPGRALITRSATTIGTGRKRRMTCRRHAVRHSCRCVPGSTLGSMIVALEARA